MLKVGIWIPLERDVYWQGEGISRTIEFIIKGMIDEGLVGSDISLTLYTTHWVEDSLQKSFLETLGENYEKVQFKYITKPKSSHLLNSFFIMDRSTQDIEVPLIDEFIRTYADDKTLMFGCDFRNKY